MLPKNVFEKLFAGCCCLLLVQVLVTPELRPLLRFLGVKEATRAELFSRLLKLYVPAQPAVSRAQHLQHLHFMAASVQELLLAGGGVAFTAMKLLAASPAAGGSSDGTGVIELLPAGQLLLPLVSAQADGGAAAAPGFVGRVEDAQMVQRYLEMPGSGLRFVSQEVGDPAAWWPERERACVHELMRVCL